MPFSISGNNAPKAQSNLTRATQAFGQATQRLSSGLRINSAVDDPGGLAVAEKLRFSDVVQTRGLLNLNDGISQLNVASGALTVATSVLMRIRELSTQASSGTLSNSQRSALNKEAQKLVEEFNRIGASTTFNGTNVFDSTLSTVSLQAGGNQFGVNLAPTVTAGSGTLAASAIIGGSAKTNPDNIALADVNGDGNLDYVFRAATDGTVNVGFGNGNGTFAAFTSYAGPAAPNGQLLQVDDFNNDGNGDIIVANQTDNSIIVYLNNGNGTFQAPKTSSATGGTKFVGADFNNDGKLDLLVNDLTSGHTLFLAGNGDGTFRARVDLNQGVGGTGYYAATDIDGDGNLDYAVAGANILLFRGNGNGTFGAPTVISTPTSSNRFVQFADFNADGLLDIAYGANADAGVAIQQAGGTFSAAVTIGVTVAQGYTVGDFNDDGRADLVATDAFGVKVFSYSNSGTITTTSSTNGLIPGFFLASGDINGDGALDVVAPGYNTNQLYTFFGVAQQRAVSLSEKRLTDIDLSTAYRARAAQKRIDQYLDYAYRAQGAIGASQSRAVVAFSNLQAQNSITQQAEHAIRDSDVAEELANLTKAKILQTGATAILAQNNLNAKSLLTVLGF